MLRSARWALVVSGLFAGAVAIHAQGCTSAQSQLSDGSLGKCNRPLDQSNPCIVETCPNGGDVTQEILDGASCEKQGNPGKCNSMGACIPDCLMNDASTCSCDDDSECPGTEECRTWSCNAGKCLPTNVNEGKDSDPNPCRSAICTGGKPVESIIAVGELCGDPNAGTVCDETQTQCVNCVKGTSMGCDSSKGETCYEVDMELQCLPCNNGVKDGTETDKDCGGKCAPCGQSKFCELGTDCVTGFCFDKVCCATDCSADCYSCAQDPIGECKPVPSGVVDGNCKDTMVSMMACLYILNKATCAPGKHLGDSCNADIDCASSACSNKKCRARNGDYCTLNEQCGSNTCDTTAHKCVPCSDSTDCGSGGNDHCILTDGDPNIGLCAP